MLAGVVFLGCRYIVYGPLIQVEKDQTISIHPEATHLDSLSQQLTRIHLLPYPKSFKWVANLMSFKPKAGKFRLPKASTVIIS